MMGRLRICDNKGFHIEFDNGYTVSVQFGGGNYCDNYDFPIGKERDGRGMKSSNAEVAVLKPDRELMELPEFGDAVAPRQTVAQILEWLNKVAAYP